MSESDDETRFFLEAKAKQKPQTQESPSKRSKAKNDAPHVTPVQERVPVLVSAPAPHVASPSVGTAHEGEPMAHVQAQEGQQAIPLPQPRLAVDAIGEGLRVELDALRQERGVIQASIEAIRAEMRVHHVVLAEQLACVREELQQIIHTQHDVHVPLRLFTEAIQVQAEALAVCGNNEEEERERQDDELLPTALPSTPDEEGLLPCPTSGTRESMRSHPKPLLLGGDRRLPLTPAPVRQRRWEPA